MTPEAALAALAIRPIEETQARTLMRLCLFDWAVCAVAGNAEPVARILRETHAGQGQGAHLVGGGEAAPAIAALVNGATSHALDYDDTHFGHIGHTSVAVMPAILAMAEARGAGTEAALEAALVGSEAALRTGLWLGRSHYQVGFHMTATSGAVGACVAAARLAGLDAAATGHAIGLVSTKAAGLKSQFGTMGKPLNAGLAAEAGVLAVLWAEAGMTGAEAGLSGPQGLGETHHGEDNRAAFVQDGWRITGLSHKFHACCHGLHAMLEALRTLTVDADRVEAVVVETHPRWLRVCDQPAPTTGLGVKFSYRMTAAMALRGVSTADPDNFTDAVAADPRLIGLRDRVSVVATDALTEMQARVAVTLSDGTVLRASHDLDAPLSLDARETRLRQKAETVLGPGLSEELWSATGATDPGALIALIAQDARS